MKKVSVKRKKWSDKKSRLFVIRKNRKNNKLPLLLSHGLSSNSYNLFIDRKKILVPKNVRFFGEDFVISPFYQETTNFIDAINQSIFTESKNIFLDFSQCQDISLEAILILTAEIERCDKKKPNSILGNYPNNQNVYFLLCKVGFFKSLKIEALKPEIVNTPRIKVIPIQSGTDNPKKLMKNIKKLIDNNDMSKSFYRVLTEAVYNSNEHAYPEDFKKGNNCVPYWWRAGFKDITQNNRILVLFFDQGKGIPNTLEKEGYKNIIQFFLNKFKTLPNDAEKIDIAVQNHYSSTKIDGRGRGFDDMRKFIEKSSHGHLTIMSYNGLYVFSKSKEGTKAEKHTLPFPIKGTLLIWQVCLNEMENIDNV